MPGEGRERPHRPFFQELQISIAKLPVSRDCCAHAQPDGSCAPGTCSRGQGRQEALQLASADQPAGGHLALSQYQGCSSSRTGRPASASQLFAHTPSSQKLTTLNYCSPTTKAMPRCTCLLLSDPRRGWGGALPGCEEGPVPSQGAVKVEWPTRRSSTVTRCGLLPSDHSPTHFATSESWLSSSR